MSNDVAGWAQPLRLAVSALAALLLLAVIVLAWRKPQSSLRTRPTAAWLALAFLLEMVAGGIIVAGNASPVLAVIHVAAAAVVWSLLIVLAVQAGLESALETEREQLGPAQTVMPVGQG